MVMMFEMGLFIDVQPITAPQMRTKEVYEKVARKMAEMHSISVCRRRVG